MARLLRIVFWMAENGRWFGVVLGIVAGSSNDSLELIVSVLDRCMV